MWQEYYKKKQIKTKVFSTEQSPYDFSKSYGLLHLHLFSLRKTNRGRREKNATFDWKSCPNILSSNMTWF